ncbi:hypothetical protein [Mycolicibacterium mageritense]|uniref:hypothetical protein n=1 Tax=Mycolicibacterium mageritense TaxID=53462 RepID=UPI001E656ECA|nr:hypothetical protein [Mycolicibacterium mageritense]GJJ24128.1 hypothetical protein MTY414_78020 [Mycolicibacterium mageritense]
MKAARRSGPTRCGECGRPRGDEYLRRGLCHACYERARRAGVITSTRVSALPARVHLAQLLGAGWGYRRIAAATGIDRTVLRFIITGRETIAATTSAAILAVEIPDPDAAAIAHRELCAAGERGEYISPQRKYRHARAQYRRQGVQSIRALTQLAREFDTTVDQLIAEKAAEGTLNFAERYVEMSDHCRLADWEIARRMGIGEKSLEQAKARHARALEQLRTVA